MQKGLQYIGWAEKREQLKQQSGPVRRGVGMAIFWYNTAVWPISLELSGCRMIMNQDGSIQLFTGDTEIGQGADTVFAQMAAETVGLRFEDVHVISVQDTDIHPFGTGAYGSRQTYVVGMAIQKTGRLLKEKILRRASEQTGVPAETLDVREAA
jgi:xanthine dehydrogenase molybdenum-binding subunit